MLILRLYTNCTCTCMSFANVTFHMGHLIASDIEVRIVISYQLIITILFNLLHVHRMKFCIAGLFLKLIRMKSYN